MSRKHRKALEEIHSHITNCLGGKLSETKMLMDVKNIINKALAEPLKNCEVGTVREQSLRFHNFCDSNRCDKCPLKKTSGDCGLIWAQMPYESEVK